MLRPGVMIRLLTVGLLLATLSAFGVAAAQESVELMPIFGDGTLTVEGRGFRPNENVTVVARVDGQAQTFDVSADAQGGFRLETGMRVGPGQSVDLQATGDQGSGGAAITAPPAVPPATPGPSVLPRSGGIAALPLLFAAGAALVAGLALRRLR